MEKQYELSGCKLEISFSRQLVQIKGTKSLKRFLSRDIENRSEVLVNAIKMDYFQFFDAELAITNDSLIIEIWGHVYAAYFAKAMEKLIQLKVVDDMANFIINRAESIDCGESEIDSNRFFWDILANFKSIILTFIPKKIKH